jgi:prepilin-type N-terminal cleavage/methylation domain-containing protein
MRPENEISPYVNIFTEDFMRNKRNKINSKGFTLVELIVVLVILAILASFLVPSLTGYIDKAKQSQAIAETRRILVAAQATLSECYATEQMTICKKTTIDNATTYVGGVTNTALKNAYDDNASTNKIDRKIAASILHYASDANIKPGTNASKPFGQNCSTFLKTNNANFGIICIYSEKGVIVFLQVYHNGVLVTYANGTYIANDKKDAKFINFGEAWSTAFEAAGVPEASIDERLKNSKIPTQDAWNQNPETLKK